MNSDEDLQSALTDRRQIIEHLEREIEVRENRITAVRRDGCLGDEKEFNKTISRLEYEAAIVRKELSEQNKAYVDLYEDIKRKIIHISQRGEERREASSVSRTGLKAANENPPLLAEALTRLVTSPKIADRVLDARHERFCEHLLKRGACVAKTFYWTDTLKSCWPALKVAGRWVIAGEFVRRWFSS